MPRPAPDLSARARGALLGLAAGNALGVPGEFLDTAEAIAARFPGGVRDILPGAAAPWDDDLALAVCLAEELLEPEVSLERLAHRWIGWMNEGGRGIGIWTRPGPQAPGHSRLASLLDRRPGGQRRRLPLHPGGAGHPQLSAATW